MANLAPLPALPGKGKTKTPQKCACGCPGGITKGGRFIPGHDSRMNGWAIRIAGGHATDGITPGERAAAERHIAATPKLKAINEARIKAQADAAKAEAKTA